MNNLSKIGIFLLVTAVAVLADQPQKENRVEALVQRLEKANYIRIYGTLMFWDPLNESKRFIDANSTSLDVIRGFSAWIKTASWRQVDFYEPFASATTVGIEFKIEEKWERIAIFGGCLKIGSRIYEEYDTELPSGLFLRKWLSENRDRFVFVKDK
jgi:hypothetical protein